MAQAEIVSFFPQFPSCLTMDCTGYHFDYSTWVDKFRVGFTVLADLAKKDLVVRTFKRTMRETLTPAVKILRDCYHPLPYDTFFTNQDLVIGELPDNDVLLARQVHADTLLLVAISVHQGGFFGDYPPMDRFVLSLVTEAVDIYHDELGKSLKPRSQALVNSVVTAMANAGASHL